MVRNSCQDSPNPSCLQRQLQRVSVLGQVSPGLVSFFSWIKQNLLSALCSKWNPWTAPWREKLDIMKQIKRKRGKPNFWEKNPTFPPSSLLFQHFSVLWPSHTWFPSFQTSHRNEFLEGAEGSPPTLQWFGEGSEDGEAKNVSPVCPGLLTPAVPYLSHTVGVTRFAFYWVMANQCGYKEIQGISCFFSVSNRVETVNDVCPWKERVNITETERSGARAESFVVIEPFCKCFTVGKKKKKGKKKLHQEWVWLGGWLLTEG